MKKTIKKKYKNLIFDLDGVLIDSKENMRVSWQAVQKKFSLMQEFDDYFILIGRPFKEILKKLGIKHKLDEIEEEYKTTSENNLNLIKLYPNVLETLKFFSENTIVMAVVTSKDKDRTKKILADYDFFKLTVSPSENLRGKPHPDQIIFAMDYLNMNLEDCVYIGDTSVDAMAAKASNIDFLYAGWGYGPEPEGEFSLISNFADIKSYIHR